jgi:hypothetical protein
MIAENFETAVAILAMMGISVIIRKVLVAKLSGKHASHCFMGTGDSAQYGQHRPPVRRGRSNAAPNRPTRISFG